MKKLLIFSTLLLSAFTIFVQYKLPGSLWLIESHPSLYVFQGLIIALLVALLVVNPPRPLVLRIAAALSGLAIMAISTFSLLNYGLSLVEWVIYAEVAIILCIESLEVNVPSNGGSLKRFTISSISHPRFAATRAAQQD